ncbi:MAG: hypothetical protein ACK5U8_27480 [Deltaproteobacteria bacterium]
MSEPSPRKTTLGAGLTLAGVFALGMLAGLGVAPMLGPPPAAGGPPRIDQLAHELELSAAQEREAEAIVERHRAEVEATMAGVVPRLQDIHDQVESELRALMTPAQQREFDRIRASRPHPLPGT